MPVTLAPGRVDPATLAPGPTIEFDERPPRDRLQTLCDPQRQSGGDRPDE